MTTLLSLEQALAQMLEAVPAPTSQGEILPLNRACGRICAQDIMSPINVPSFDNAAMDGYAVRFSDLQQNLTLQIAGKAFAGAPFTGEWREGCAVRIMTGAMIPEGCDAVIMQEQAQLNADGSVTFTELPRKGQHIRRQGEDLQQGALALKRGEKLTAFSLPLLASLGIGEVAVYPRLKVALIATGDELTPVGKPLSAGKIYDSNSFTLKLLLEKLPCELIDFGILPDDEQQFRRAFIAAQQQADLVISSGGVSVGEADFTKQVLASLGAVNFWKIAIKPGKPFAFGKLQHAWFCGLPGNPVSALVTFCQLVQPLIAKLSGFSQWRAAPQLRAIAAQPLKKAVGRVDFQRGFYQYNQAGELEVRAVGAQGSHLFSAFLASNCFIRLEQQRGNVAQGESVIIEPFSGILE